jgi:hypothetical protein
MHSIGQLKRLQWAVRAVLALGIAASVAANILHAEPNLISRTISAWPPLALLLTVELVSRIPVTRPLLAVVRIGATATIAGIAAWVSYWHMVGVVGRYGETGESPYLIPITVDGLIVVASVSLVELTAKLIALQTPVAEKVLQVVETLGGPVSVEAPAVAPVVDLPAAGRRVKGGPRGGRSGPQDSGPSLEGLNGRALMLDTPKV